MSLAVVGAALGGERVGLRAVDGVIAALGPDVVAEPGDDVLDGTGRLLLPGLVNGHTHAAMTLFRGYGSDLRLMDWLEHRIWPAEARLTDDDVYWGTRLACVEMIRTGTVRFWDMYWEPVAVARAVEDAGLRAAVGLPLVDGMDPERAKEVQSAGGDVLDLLAETGPRITPSLTPHGIYTVSAPTLSWAAEQSRAFDAPLQLHFLEVEDEVTGCLERYGERPAALLDRLGVLGPTTILSHGVWMEPPELELVAARGCTVVTNPVSNLKLAVGRIFPYAEVREHGIPIGLGTDGASSNNALDLLADVKVLALVQKHRCNDPAALPAAEAWDVVTGALAPALGGTALEVGAPADFLLARADATELVPGDPITNLVYAASGSVIDATVVDGRVLMHDGVIDEEDEVRSRAVEAARRLGVLEDVGA
ncbi:MAG TPA: amidohydrolase [Acidimicrobiia bacterium]|jgi:5-methylthioadenosine/S-adenosylhomocysteine deaminase